ncbi:MAG: LPXTG cell wall anchor domain-containing protein [Segatella salivae]
MTPKVQDKKNLPNTGDIENIGLTSGLATLGIAAYVAAMRKRHKK